MAVDTYIVGNDGNVTISVGGTTSTIMKVNSFSANLSRSVHNITGFGDTGGRRRLGMLDVTGTLNGFAGVEFTAATNTAVSILWVNAQNATNATSTHSTPVVSLMLFDSTNDAKIVSTAVLHSFNFNSAKTGDASVSCQFENADGAAPVVTWLI